MGYTIEVVMIPISLLTLVEILFMASVFLLIVIAVLVALLNSKVRKMHEDMLDISEHLEKEHHE